MGLRKIAESVRQANVDAEVARRTANSPQFRREVTKDRRAALSRYATVRDALRDRRLAAAKAASPAKAPRKSSANKSSAKKSG